MSAAGPGKRRSTSGSASSPPRSPCSASGRGCPEQSATLQQLASVLTSHEPDLRDRVFDLVCEPRHLARCWDDLPLDPAGVLGMFAVTVPMGTTVIDKDAFRGLRGPGAGVAADHGHGAGGGSLGLGGVFRM